MSSKNKPLGIIREFRGFGYQPLSLPQETGATAMASLETDSVPQVALNPPFLKSVTAHQPLQLIRNFYRYVPFQETRTLDPNVVVKVPEKKEKVMLQEKPTPTTPSTSAYPRRRHKKKKSKPVVEETKRERIETTVEKRHREEREDLRKRQKEAAPFYAKMDAINWGWPRPPPQNKLRRNMVRLEYPRVHRSRGRYRCTWKKLFDRQRRLADLNVLKEEDEEEE